MSTIAQTKSLTILVVDDGLVNRKVAMRILENLGHRCHEAENGRAAVQALQSARYDLVIMDCEMPEMDGYEAASAIRKMDGEPGSTPILALTGHDSDRVRAKCLAAGMNEVLSKPLNVAQLQNRIVQRFVP